MSAKKLGCRDLSNYASNALHHNALLEANKSLQYPATVGKVVAFIALGNDLAKEEVYRYLISITGIIAIVVESPGNKLTESLSISCGKQVISVPLCLENRPTLVQDVVAAIDASLMKHNLNTLDGLLTYWDDAVALAARVAMHYQLPSNSIASIDLAHDKARSRNWLRDLGYPCPKSIIITHADGLKSEAMNTIKYPLIIKPVFGAASIGVVKVHNQNELTAKFLEVQEILKDCYSEKDLMGLLFDDAQHDASIDNSNQLLNVVVEEFLEGREYDCDIVVRDGEVIWSELCDDWDYVAPHFVELGSNVPTTTDRATENKVKDYAQKIALGMGLTSGVHHVEIIDDKNLGPVLVECNPRMGGGPVRMNHLVVNNIDLAVEALYACLNIAPAISQRPERRLSNATACLFATKSGRLLRHSQECLNEVIESCKENVILATSNCEVGRVLKGWGTKGQQPTGLGLLSVSIDGSVQEAKDLVNMLREAFLNQINQHIDFEDQTATN